MGYILARGYVMRAHRHHTSVGELIRVRRHSRWHSGRHSGRHPRLHRIQMSRRHVRDGLVLPLALAPEEA